MSAKSCAKVSSSPGVLLIPGIFTAMTSKPLTVEMKPAACASRPTMSSLDTSLKFTRSSKSVKLISKESRSS